MDDLSVKQRVQALTHLVRREMARFEAETGARIEAISISRVYEDISSVNVKLENRYGSG